MCIPGSFQGWKQFPPRLDVTLVAAGLKVGNGKTGQKLIPANFSEELSAPASFPRNSYSVLWRWMRLGGGERPSCVEIFKLLPFDDASLNFDTRPFVLTKLWLVNAKFDQFGLAHLAAAARREAGHFTFAVSLSLP